MKRSKHLQKMIKERDKRVALALAALSKNRAEMIALIALFVAAVTGVIEYLRH
jgi:hypothetical protein